MTLEDGLDPLPEPFAWNLGGLDLDGFIGVKYDSGLEDIETEFEETDSAGDGGSPGWQRIPSREVTIAIQVAPDSATKAERETAIDEALDQLAEVINPLPNRLNELRMFRYRRAGGPAKRLYYRAANGTALGILGDEARIKYDNADVAVRIYCPDGIRVSDEYEDITFTAGQTKTITNNGKLAAVGPVAYTVTASSTLRLQNLTHGGDITYPSPGGALTVSRTLEIHGTATGGARTWGLCTGPGGLPVVDPVVLYPGDNQIKASAPCTIRKWDTW